MNEHTDTDLRSRIVTALRTVRDPEIPVNIYDLGLVYELSINDANEIAILMTLTAPSCPVAETLPGDVSRAVSAVAGVRGVNVDLVWDPPWSPARMSEAARLELGIPDDWEEQSEFERENRSY